MDRKVIVDRVWRREYSTYGAVEGGWSNVAYTRIRVEHRGEIPCAIELPLNYSPKVWFWWGVVLLGSIVPAWLFSFEDTFLLIPAAIVTGIGSYCVWRGLRVPKPFEFLKRVKFFDKDVYTQWQRLLVARQTPTRAPRLLNIPRKIKIDGRKAPTALRKEDISMAREWATRIFDVPNISALQRPRGYKPRLRIELNQLAWFRKEGLAYYRKAGRVDEINKARAVLVNIAEKIEKY
jgi:hypothetical protein